MIEHYIVGNPGRREVDTICGTRINPHEFVPGPDVVRCLDCEKALTMVQNALAYARARKITPVEAGKALNMSPFVCIELATRS